MRIKLIFLLFFCFCHYFVYAQQGDFCNAVSTIMRDAPNKFRNTRGKLKDANANATIWNCEIKIPGTISSRFVASMGLFYEGAFLQTPNKDDLKAIYDKYKAKLDSCLIPLGYTLYKNENFYPGLADYKKLVYLSDADDVGIPTSAPPHVSMEVAYNKDIDVYTIVMYIFEH